MSDESELQAQIATAERIIREAGQSLRDLGYQFERHQQVPSELLGEMHEFVFANVSTGLSVTFSFASEHGRFGDGLSVSVGKSDGNGFLVTDFIGMNEPIDKDSLVGLKQHTGTFEDRLRGSVDVFTKYLLNQLRPVLLGEYWPDVPFDWRGYK